MKDDRNKRRTAGRISTPTCEHCGWFERKRTEKGARIAFGIHLRRAHGVLGAGSAIVVPTETSSLRRGAGDNFDSRGLLELLALGKRRAA